MNGGSLYFQACHTILHEATVVDTCHYTFVKTQNVQWQEKEAIDGS